MENNNAKTIQALRDAADYLAAHPDIPPLSFVFAHASVSSIDELKAAARAMGSFTKHADDHYYRLRHGDIGDPFYLEVCIPRETICKKVITWECPDDPLLAIPDGSGTAEIQQGDSINGN